jgi:hypothetical protein
MANSKLLKEAIADAKAVKETALANAKLALEEAFTPRLQSILSQKLRAEAEAEEKDAEKVDEELKSDEIGSKVDAGYAETPGKQPNYDAITDLSVGVKKDSGKPEQAGTDYKKVADISEEEMPGEEDAMAAEKSPEDEIAELKARLAELEAGMDSEEELGDEDPFAEMGDEMGDDMGSEMGDEEESEDDLDLEAIIRELEAQLGDEESEEGSEEEMYEAEEEDDKEEKNENLADGSEAGTDKGPDPKLVVTNEEEMKDDEEKNEVIDLEEILREMEADMKKDDEKVDEAEEEEKEKELQEAYKTIKSLQKTINEVNLLNAKLLFANKLFRAHNMTNEQKVKVIETLDRTKSVREVKLVFSTLAENFKYASSNKAAKKTIKEGIASKAVKSTAPKAAKQVIAESADFADRFKKLAGIIK